MSHIGRWLAVMGILLSGCEPRLVALSSPPPSKLAELDNESGTITLSQGVALAFSCTKYRRPCDGPASTDNPETAEVRGAFLDDLTKLAQSGPRPANVHVLIGRDAGLTQLHIDGRDLSVTVIGK